MIKAYIPVLLYIIIHIVFYAGDTMYYKKSILRLFVISCLVLCTMAYGMKRGLKGHNVPVGKSSKLRRAEETSIQVPSTPVKRVLAARRVVVSPQKAQVDARNTVRCMFEALKNSDKGLAVQNALRTFAEWRQRFPAYFGKIHWRVPLEGEDELQFKYKLNSALDSALLLCIANGSRHAGQELIAPAFASTYTANQVKVSFGGFQMIVENSLGGQFKYEMTRTGTCETLSYNPNNSIKQTLTTWLFHENDVDHLQEGLQAVFSHIPQELRINKEQFYHALIYGMISFLGSNFGQIEVYTGQGRADLIVQHDVLGKCIIEFKLNSNAQGALAQIQAQKYSMYFGPGQVLAIGINIQHAPLTVTCAKKIITITSPQITVEQSKAGTSVARFSGNY